MIVLQITQPPFFPVFLFVITEPFTNWIQRKHNTDPDNVHCKKRITFTGSNELGGYYLGIHFQTFSIGMSSRQKTNGGNKMDQKEMENIIKKRYTAIHSDKSCKPVFFMPNTSKK
jgi:hypothetical protein